MSLLVVTVAYGNDPQVKALARAVAAWPDARLVVVDNSPEQERVSSVATVVPPANVGYARGVNMAVEYGGSWDHLLVVNPDVVPRLDPRILTHHFEDASVLAVCGRLDVPGSHLPVSNVHPRVTPGREVLRSLVGWRAYVDHQAATGSRDVAQADGAWLLFTRGTWNRIGGFDERFELYFEDVEIADRIRSLGGRLRFDPSLVGVHEAGSSARRSGELAHLLLGVSRVRYYHVSGCTRHPVLLGRSTSCLEFVARSVTSRPEGFGARWRALRLQWVESGAPGSVWLLGAPRSMGGRRGPDVETAA